MSVLQPFVNTFKIKELRGRIFITLALITVFQAGAHIILPGVDPKAVEELIKKSSGQGGFLGGMLAVISGGAFTRMGLCALGIAPYITSSIIMSLFSEIDERLKALKKESGGQRKINQYARLLTVPICIIQALAMVNMIMGSRDPILATSHSVDAWIMMIIGLTAGGMFVMWLGEQITELGIGNGASVLIMIGILGRIPDVVMDLALILQGNPGFDKNILAIVIIYLLVVASVVIVSQSQRRIPIQSAKQIRGRRVAMGPRNYLPLRVNTAGVMPVIFASAVMGAALFLTQIPGMDWLKDELLPGRFLNALIEVVLIMFFSYFWTYLAYKPVDVANNLKEYGSFIPGIRPGQNTAQYIDFILARITLFGAVFLCTITLLPDITGNILGVNRMLVAFLGGTGILIVVGVCLDVITKIESYLLLHRYSGFVGTSPIRGRR